MNTLNSESPCREKIITTNGAKLSDNEVYWEFDGKDLNNRHIPIKVISVVEK